MLGAYDGASTQVFIHGPVVGGVTDSNANFFVRSDHVTGAVLRAGSWQKFSYQPADCFLPDCRGRRYLRSFLFKREPPEKKGVSNTLLPWRGQRTSPKPFPSQPGEQPLLT